MSRYTDKVIHTSRGRLLIGPYSSEDIDLLVEHIDTLEERLDEVADAEDC